ncbi:SGNH hydrolase-type esterase domain-containing protein [Chytriomyces sp. MP71]|nr:SGNH hydrolase-type esterase domain-containing protein [Chytriomyces sp. MP71]
MGDPTVPDLSYDQIIFLGDSFTDLISSEGGWANLLARDYSPVMDVKFRARAGYNTFWLKSALPSLLQNSPQSKVKLVTLLIGTNDATEPGQLSNVPVDLYEENLREILNIIHKLAPEARVLVLTPPPLGTKYPHNFFSYNRVKNYRTLCTATVTAMIMDTSSEGWAKDRVALLDIWDVMIPGRLHDKSEFDPSTLSSLFSDGVHFSKKGHQVVYEAVKAKIADVWPHLEADRIPRTLPIPHAGFVRAKAGKEGDAFEVILKTPKVRSPLL